MRNLIFLLMMLFLIAPGLAQSADHRAVTTLLDDFHQAASDADGERYFGYFAPDGVFIGTDITERWSLAEFKAYAMPYFGQGRGWTYVPQERHVSFSPGGNVAWFDETLQSQSFGPTRGSGVLVKTDGAWKLSQYHLTIPIPNDLAEEVVEMIKSK
jgi:ketosteroid isomerase-like protein